MPGTNLPPRTDFHPHNPPNTLSNTNDNNFSDSACTSPTNITLTRREKQDIKNQKACEKRRCEKQQAEDGDEDEDAGQNPRLPCLTSHWMTKNHLKHFSCISILKVPKSLHLLFVVKHKHRLPSLFTKALSSIQRAIHSIPYRNGLLLRLPVTSNFSPSRRCTGSLRSRRMLLVS